MEYGPQLVGLAFPARDGSGPSGSRSPPGDTAALSASLDNSYEALQFTAQSTGQYVLRVSRSGCDSSPNGVAWAWYNASAPAATPTATITPTPLASTATPTRTLTLPPTLTPTLPPTVTLTPTATRVPPMCAPNRPPVSVSVVPIGNGALQVVVSAPTLPAGSAPNMLNGVRFGTAVNARVDAGTVTNAAGNFTAAAQAGSQQMSFQVRQGVRARRPLCPIGGDGRVR